MHSQAPITNEEDGPSQLEISASAGGTKGGTDAVSNTTPQDLSNKRGFLGHRHINDTETRSSGLSDDDILRPEELSHTRPQIHVINNVAGIVGNGEGDLRNRDLLRNCPELSQLGRQLGKEPLEADSGVEGVQDSGVVRVKLIRGDWSVRRDQGLGVAPHLNGLAPWDVIRKVSGVEVAEHRSDGNKQFRTLDLLKDVRVADGSNINLEGTAQSPAVATS